MNWKLERKLIGNLWIGMEGFNYSSNWAECTQNRYNYQCHKSQYSNEPRIWLHTSEKQSGLTGDTSIFGSGDTFVGGSVIISSTHHWQCCDPSLFIEILLSSETQGEMVQAKPSKCLFKHRLCIKFHFSNFMNIVIEFIFRSLFRL